MFLLDETPYQEPKEVLQGAPPYWLFRHPWILVTAISVIVLSILLYRNRDTIKRSVTPQASKYLRKYLRLNVRWKGLFIYAFGGFFCFESGMWAFKQSVWIRSIIFIPIFTYVMGGGMTLAQIIAFRIDGFVEGLLNVFETPGHSAEE